MTAPTLGLQAFAEACEIFKLFSTSIEVPTQYCRSIISGGMNPQVNYIYDVDLNNIAGLAKDLAALRASGYPMTLLCEEGLSDADMKTMGLKYECDAQTKTKNWADTPYTPNPEIAMKLVETEADLHAWRSIAAECFEYPLGCDDGLFKRFNQAGPHHDQVKLILAYVDNQPVGQGMLVLGKTFSACMWGSVLPAYRKRGVCTEMVRYRTAVGAQLGYPNNVVQCMPMSASAYDKLGYQNMDTFGIYTLVL